MYVYVYCKCVCVCVRARARGYTHTHAHTHTHSYIYPGKPHDFGWRDFVDISIKWRQISEPNDPVFWSLSLPLAPALVLLRTHALSVTAAATIGAAQCLHALGVRA